MRTTSGSADTRLILIRGNSASGKSTVAAGLRERYGRDIAIVGQDYLRRTVLRERDIPGGANIGLIDQTARYCLDHGFHTIVEGILYADRYADMLTVLRTDHQGLTCCYYLHVPFEETLRRHATKPQATEYGRAQMSDWYRDLDLLPGVAEHVIPAEMSLDETVHRIMADARLTNDATTAAEAEHPRQACLSAAARKSNIPQALVAELARQILGAQLETIETDVLGGGWQKTLALMVWPPITGQNFSINSILVSLSG